MAGSPYSGSEYLQSKLRERRAENARSSTGSKHSDPDSLPRRQRPARDDIIFADDTSPPRRRASERVYQSSPANAAQAMAFRASQARRPSNHVAGVADSSRALGAREAEERIDKLSKQNFDLKLEVFHRREKVLELEKKLEELRQDYEGLREANEETLQELDKRDAAIDQAVAIIDEHENSLQLLQDRVDALEAAPGSRTEAQKPPDESQDTNATRSSHPEQRGGRSKRLSVSPEVSARMAEMSSPAKKGPRPVPSFLRDEQIGTRTLRSHFMDGDRQIRPIPSFATLNTLSLADGEVDPDEDVLRSPALSEISESEFKSLFGRDQKGDDFRNPRHSEEEPTTPTAQTPISEKVKLARTHEWVNDSAVRPSASRKSSSSSSSLQNQQSQAFQSLTGVLHDGSIVNEGKPTDRRRRQSKRAPDAKRNTRSAPFVENPIFGQNVYPPTPDTMHTRETRPSTHSSSSATLDRMRSDPLRVMTDESTIDAQKSRKQPLLSQDLMTSRSSLLKRSQSCYSATENTVSPHLQSEPSSAVMRDPEIQVDEFASTQTQRRPSQPYRERSFDPTSPRRLLSTERLSTSDALSDQARSFASRSRNPRHIHGASVALEDRPLPRRRNSATTATQQTLAELSPSARRASTSQPADASSPSADARQPASIRNVQATKPTSPRWHQQAPSGQSLEEPTPPKPPKHATLPARSSSRGKAIRPTDTLRQRVSKFTRQNSSQAPPHQPSDTASTASFHTPPPAPIHSPQSSKTRSNSFTLRTRKLFQRRRSSASQKSPPISPTQSIRRITQSNGEEDIAASTRSSTFMDAAKAAMPHLDMVGNERRTPTSGISTGIPVMSTPPSQNNDTASGRSKTGDTNMDGTLPSPTLGKGRRNSSDVAGFPRRGREGRVASRRAEEAREQQ
ncbi:MAG: hypothetical protein Q9159_001182 [Coniocarpon cinnabarinum]